jgi:hypothetical protein
MEEIITLLSYISENTPLRSPVATSEPAVEISAKDRDKPVERNLPEEKPRTPILGVICTDTPLQGASISSIPTAGEDLRHLVSLIAELLHVLKRKNVTFRWGEVQQAQGGSIYLAFANS